MKAYENDKNKIIGGVSGISNTYYPRYFFFLFFFLIILGEITKRNFIITISIIEDPMKRNIDLIKNSKEIIKI